MPKKTVMKAQTPSRNEQIRGYVEQMQQLLDERNFANVQIRNLHVKIRKELAIPRDDFITAMRLIKLATDKREKTVANVGEVLRAIGTPFQQLKQLRSMERLERDD
jgi:hypothetical protein